MTTIYTGYIRRCIISIITLFAAISAVSAQVNTLYYMKTVATRHELNPSFQPLPNSYYSILPVLAGTSVGIGNNALVLNDVIYPKKTGGENKTVWFFNSESGNVDKFYDRLKNTTQVYSETDFRLFAMGLRMSHDSYLTVGLSTKTNTGVFIPKDLAKLLLYGATNPAGMNSFNLDRFGIRANIYTELAVGYSRPIDDRLTVGGKFKLIIGHANATTKVDKIRLNASREMWDFDIEGTVNVSVPGIEYKLNSQGMIDNVNFNLFDNFQFGNLVGGMGAALDLGANYKLLDDRLTVSASLLDLGFIRWNDRNASNIPVDGHFEFEGVEIGFENGVANWDEDYFENIQDNIKYTTTYKPYTSGLAAKIMLGAEYGIIDNWLTVGGLSKSTIINKSVFQEITASVNYLKFDFFNASLSYSLFNGRFQTFGLGLGGRLGPVNIYVAGDYMPLKYTKQYIPYKNKAFNIQTGILLNLGYKTRKNAGDSNAPNDEL